MKYCKDCGPKIKRHLALLELRDEFKALDDKLYPFQKDEKFHGVHFHSFNVAVSNILHEIERLCSDA